MNHWKPTTNLEELRLLGKLGEELGELTSAVSRCIIQGINESEPITGKPNRQWLEEEIADVIACLEMMSRLKLDTRSVAARVIEKKAQYAEWANMGDY